MTSAIKWHLIKQLILNVLSFYHIFDDEGPDPLLVYLLKSGYTEVSVSNYKDEPKATPLKVSSLLGPLQQSRLLNQASKRANASFSGARYKLFETQALGWKSHPE